MNRRQCSDANFAKTAAPGSLGRRALAALLLPLAALARAQPLWVHSRDISVSLDASSFELLALNTSSGLALDVAGSAATLGDTAAAPLLLNASAAACGGGGGGGGGGVCVTRWLRVLAQHSNASCCELYDVRAVTSFLPVEAAAAAQSLPSAIAWRLDVTSGAPLAWRTTIAHSLDTSAAARSNASDVRFWTPRGGNVSSAAAWEDVLRMSDAAGAPQGLRTQYGVNMLFDDTAGREVSPLPAAALAFASAGAGVGLVQALDDRVFGLATDVSAGGAALKRYYNRLGQGRTVSLTAYLVPIAGGADWRPLLLWARGAMPRFFLSATLLASAAGAGEGAAPPAEGRAAAPLPVPAVVKTGLGLYSCANAEDMNLTELRASGATHNWDAHFEWPYIGMYLPPPDVTWASNLGSGEEGNCGAGWTHGQLVNTTIMRSIYANAFAAGITTLTYFNLVEFGENFACPLPAPINPPPDDDWRDSSQFVADHMPQSPWPGCPNTGWQNGVDLNPADPGFSDFLVEQATLHVERLGMDFRGFAVDRLDHLSMYDMGVAPPLDDGLAWCGSPCNVLMTGWNAALARVAAVVYGSGAGAQSIITGNFVGIQRVDALQHIDGIMEVRALARCATGRPARGARRC